MKMSRTVRLLVVDDEIRKTLSSDPRLETVARVARQRGNLTLLEQAYRAVLEGRTALTEIQRVMAPRQPAKGSPARK